MKDAITKVEEALADPTRWDDRLDRISETNKRKKDLKRHFKNTERDLLKEMNLINASAEQLDRTLTMVDLEYPWRAFRNVGKVLTGNRLTNKVGTMARVWQDLGHGMRQVQRTRLESMLLARHEYFPANVNELLRQEPSKFLKKHLQKSVKKGVFLDKTQVGNAEKYLNDFGTVVEHPEWYKLNDEQNASS